MNAAQAKQIADEYIADQEVLMTSYVKDAVEFLLIKITEMANMGIYYIHISHSMLRQNKKSVIPEVKIKEVLMQAAASLEEEYDFKVIKSKVNSYDNECTYEVKWK